MMIFFRKFTRVQCVFVPILIVLVYSSSYFLVNKNQSVVYKTTTLRTTQESFFSPSPIKHVTKSLAQLGKMDEINKHILFLNSIPNCGSEVLVFLLQQMQGVNDYRHVRLKGPQILSKNQQEKFVEEVYEIIRNAAVPLSFDRQIAFVNFSTFDKQSPTFVNLIRDPADRASRNLSDIKLDLTIPSFCGHHKHCRLKNSKWALEIAKNNVEKYYPVVGILEELNATLEVLEEKIPYFFKGVQKLYNTKILDKFNHRKERQTKDNKMRNNLKKLLYREYEFYDWIKQRLFQQLQFLYGEHNHQR